MIVATSSFSITDNDNKTTPLKVKVENSESFLPISILLGDFDHEAHGYLHLGPQTAGELHKQLGEAIASYWNVVKSKAATKRSEAIAAYHMEEALNGHI